MPLLNVSRSYLALLVIMALFVLGTPQVVLAQPKPAPTPARNESGLFERSARTAFNASVSEAAIISNAYHSNATFRAKVDAAIEKKDAKSVTDLFIQAGARSLSSTGPEAAQIEFNSVAPGIPVAPQYKKCWGKGKWYGGCVNIAWTLSSND